MSSRLRSRHVVATAATAVAVFLAVLVLLAVHMAGGEDQSGSGTDEQAPQPQAGQAPPMQSGTS